jgi:hypothetical protein
LNTLAFSLTGKLGPNGLSRRTPVSLWEAAEGFRMDTRVKQDLVSVDFADPCHDGLVRQQGLEATAPVLQALLEGAEIRSGGVRSQALVRPSLAWEQAR